MAKSGAIIISQGKQDIINNQTQITVTGRITTSGESWRGSSRTGTVVVAQNGSTIYQGSFTSGAPANSTTTLFSIPLTITHDNNGNSGTITASYNYDNGWCSASGLKVLTPISRKSRLSVSDGILATQQILTVHKTNDEYTHTIRYECGGRSGLVCAEKTSVTSIPFTPPLILAEEAPNGTSVYVTFIIETFDGETSIGSNSYSIWCEIPEYIVPNVYVDISDEMDYLSAYGSYIQGMSKFNISVDAAGVYGSKIKSCVINANGKTYDESFVVTDEIVNDGFVTISISVTDTRQRTVVVEEEVHVMKYEPPKITSLVIKRTDADGSSNSNGAYLTAVFDAQIQRLDDNVSIGYKQNEAVFKAKYVNKGNSSDSNETTFLLDDYDVKGGTYTFPANQSSSYDFTLIVHDAFTQRIDKPTIKTVVGGTATKLWSIFKKGLGFAFGKVAQLQGYFEVGFKAMFYSSVHVKGALTYDIPADWWDCDEILVSGRYYLGTESTNRPIEKNGWLDVQSVVDANFCYQKFIAYTGEKYERFRTDGKWGDWFLITSSVADFVLEEGTEDGWSYRKWNSGIAECWYTYDEYVDMSANNYGGYYYCSPISVSLPLDFTSITNYQVTGGSQDVINFARSFGIYTESKKAVFLVAGHQPNMTNTKITVYLSVIGKWK